MSTPSLTRQAGLSALWQVAGGVWAMVVRLGASIFLARALTPTDYGIFGMAIIMRELVEHLGAFGVGAGIIARKSVTEDDLCTCFWLLVGSRIFMFLIAFFCAPLAGWFFDDSRVIDVVQVISIAFLFSILGGLSQTLLFKSLRFKELNILRGFFVILESSLAIVLALNTDFGYWSLVIAMMISTFFSELAIFILAGWMPKFKFNNDSFHYLFRFGINGLGYSITNYLRQNLDYLLVGRLLGATSLGLYEFAYRIPHLLLDRVSRPVGSVVFPSLSKIQDNNDLLLSGYIKAVKYVCFITFPVLFGLASVADVAVPLVWGEQWLPIVTPMRFLCLCAALKMVPQPLGSIYSCKNRPDLPFKFSIVGLLWTFLVVGSLGYFYGLVGVAIGMVLSVAEGYIALFFAFRLANGRLRKLFVELFPILFSSLLCAAAAFFVSTIFQNKGFSNIETLLASIFSGCLVYTLILFVFFPRIISEIKKLIREVVFNKYN